MKMVAKVAGVAASTVSRVYSHPHLLKGSTVIRVKQVADELGYVPHYSARALSTGQLGTIGVVVPDIANPFFPPVIRAAQARASAAGVSTLLGDTDEDVSKELDLLDLLEQRTDGIVLASSRLPEATIRARALRHPLVLINRDISGVSRVLIDSAVGMRSAVDHLARLGHKEFVYVSGPESSWSDQERRSALRGRCAELGLELRVLAEHRPVHDAGSDAAGTVLSSGASAAIVFDDVLAQGLIAGLLERGIDVPGDVSVVGCDDILAVRTVPPLTTVRGHSAAAGREAVDLLFETIKGEDSQLGRRRSIPAVLIERSSTGPASSRG